MYVQINVGQLKVASDNATRPIMAVLGNRIVTNGSARCPVDNGTLRASLYAEPVDVGGSPGVRVGSRVRYAIYVHAGTRAHIITPQTRRVLRFQGRDGGLAFRRRVVHPGTRANPFLLDAARDEVGRF